MSARIRVWIYAAVQAAAILLLAGGFAVRDRWMGAIFGLLLALAAGWHFYDHAAWLHHLLLFGCVAAAALGVWMGSSPVFMVAGTSAALAGWELSDVLPPTTTQSDPLAEAFERRRMLALGIMAVASLGVTVLLLQFPMQLPFGVLLAAAAVVLFSLFKLYRLFRS